MNGSLYFHVAFPLSFCFLEVPVVTIGISSYLTCLTVRRWSEGHDPFCSGDTWYSISADSNKSTLLCPSQIVIRYRGLTVAIDERPRGTDSCCPQMPSSPEQRAHVYSHMLLIWYWSLSEVDVYSMHFEVRISLEWRITEVSNAENSCLELWTWRILLLTLAVNVFWKWGSLHFFTVSSTEQFLSPDVRQLSVSRR